MKVNFIVLYMVRILVGIAAKHRLVFGFVFMFSKDTKLFIFGSMVSLNSAPGICRVIFFSCGSVHCRTVRVK